MERSEKVARGRRRAGNWRAGESRENSRSGQRWKRSLVATHVEQLLWLLFAIPTSTPLTLRVFTASQQHVRLHHDLHLITFYSRLRDSKSPLPRDTDLPLPTLPHNHRRSRGFFFTVLTLLTLTCRLPDLSGLLVEQKIPP